MTNPEYDIFKRDAPRQSEPKGDRGPLLSWLGFAAGLAIVGGFLWWGAGRNEAEPVVGVQSNEPAPLLDEMVWSEPQPVRDAQNIRDIKVRGGVAYALVDGWIATSTDLLEWTHIRAPDVLDQPGALIRPDEETAFDPVIRGNTIDYDVRQDALVALVRSDRGAADPDRCTPEPTGPVVGLFVSFDGADSWTELPVPGATANNSLFEPEVAGSVATDGETAVASIALFDVARTACLAERLGVEAGTRIGLRQATRQIEVFDGDQVITRVDIDDIGLSADEVPSFGIANPALTVVTADLRSGRAVGRGGPLLLSTPEGYISGFGGVPAQISNNHGQSFTSLNIPSDYDVTGELVRFRAAVGSRLSLDRGQTWTAASPNFASVIDSTNWNGTVFAVALQWAFGTEIPAGSTTLHRVDPGSEVDAQLMGFDSVEMGPIAVFNDQLALFARSEQAGDDAGYVLYLGSRPVS